MLCLQTTFVVGPPGPNQWVYRVNGQPCFKLDLFSFLQRPLPLYCTDVQLGCSNQLAVSPKSVVLSCFTLHVKVFSIASSCLVVDVIKASTIPSVCAPCVHYWLRHRKKRFWSYNIALLMKHAMSLLLASLQLLSHVAEYNNLNMFNMWSCGYQQV